MTEGLRSGIGQEWQRGCLDGNLLFPCSLSFQRRLESSGLNNPFLQGGNDNPADEMRAGGNRNPPSIPASLSSAACSQRRSTTCIHAGVDSGLRRNDETRVGGNRNPSSTLASPSSAACSRRRSTACIPVSVRPCRRERARWKCDFHGSAELAERPCFKISGLRTARLLLWGGVSLCRLPAAGRRGNSDSIRVSLSRIIPAFSLAAPAPPRLSMPAGAGLDTGGCAKIEIRPPGWTGFIKGEIVFGNLEVNKAWAGLGKAWAKYGRHCS